MDEPTVPASPIDFKQRLSDLRGDRKLRQQNRRYAPILRQSLRADKRRLVLAKTAGRCHICGGEVPPGRWNADHVLAHSSGGAHAADNYPAHRLCHNYRWDYSPEEFQWVLKIGVWARTQMKDGGVGFRSRSPDPWLIVLGAGHGYGASIRLPPPRKQRRNIGLRE